MHSQLSAHPPSAGYHYLKYFTYVPTWWVQNHEQQRPNVSTNTKFSTGVAARASFHSCCLHSYKLQMLGLCCTSVLQITFLSNITTLQVLSGKQAHETTLMDSWLGLPAQAPSGCMYQHQPVPPITPHTVESLRKLTSPLFDFWLARQVWVLTVGRNKAEAGALF